MKEFTIGRNDAGRRVDRFLRKAVPLLPASLLEKYLRLKRIKRNGTRTKGDERLSEGDVLSLYISDEFFDGVTKDDAFLRLPSPELNIVYEDGHILILDKPQGLLCHAGEEGTGDTLVDRAKAYLYEKGEYRPEQENAFAPALTHRIDRNTGGLVVLAKTLPALQEMSELIRERRLDKDYLCIVRGKPAPPEGELTHYLRRDLKRKMVSVHASPVPGGRTATLRYRTIETRENLSLVECRLLTGRTHQIRAQMAHIGCPLLGDGKYGVLGKDYRGPKYQALCAYKLSFPAPLPAPTLTYLAGRTFRAKRVPFLKEFGFDFKA